MKKILCAVVAILLCVCGMTACTDTQTASEQYDIVTTVFPAYDFARAVAGDTLKIKMLITPGGEAHGFAPTLDDLAAVQGCKLFIYTGGPTDAWAAEQFRSGNLDTSRFSAFSMMEHADLLAIPESIEDHTHEHEEHAHDGEYDEHVWTSPANAVKLIEDICEELCTLYPYLADTFRANTAAYTAKIRTCENEMRTVADNAQNKMLVFEDRFPFVYFCNHFGLSHTAAFGSCASNTEVSAATLDTLINTIKNENIPCVLYLEFSKMTTADRIVQQTGCAKYEFHSYHNVTQEDFDNGVTYVDLMQRNTAVLKEALS
ncbi:MAG: zinc ABC transporter substrate-binding protein [Clostridia bacterium]|nr:zinc ABC transporter substrate-binding protein [Clostridia bacterium]